MISPYFMFELFLHLVYLHLVWSSFKYGTPILVYSPSFLNLLSYTFPVIYLRCSITNHFQHIVDRSRCSWLNSSLYTSLLLKLPWARWRKIWKVCVLLNIVSFASLICLKFSGIWAWASYRYSREISWIRKC